jgi:branched-chain amino acid aminotransferase
MPPAAKTTGNYVNSSLAKVEALKAGYDEAIMLAPNGLIAECTGENIFAVRNNIIITPPLSAGALEGITQNSVMTIARNLGFDIRIDNLARSDLYIAEEVFVCGTAAEISSVKSIDDRDIAACPGPMTKAIAEVYARAVRGEEDQYKDWCELA